MTDRVKGCTVVFEKDIREDDVEPVLIAIRMLRGVLAVEGVLAKPGDWFAEQRAIRRFREQLAKLDKELEKEIEGT